MTRRWFSKLITAAPIAAPLASKVLAEGVSTLDNIPTPPPFNFNRVAIPPNWNLEGDTLVERSLATGFRSTSKSAHYQWLEKSYNTIREDKVNNFFSSYRKIHNCNPGYIPQVSGVQANKQRFRVRYQSPGQKWERDETVRLWNLRRKTTLAEEWEAAKNEIMEACSIEL